MNQSRKSSVDKKCDSNAGVSLLDSAKCDRIFSMVKTTVIVRHTTVAKRGNLIRVSRNFKFNSKVKNDDWRRNLVNTEFTSFYLFQKGSLLNRTLCSSNKKICPLPKKTGLKD